MADYIIKDTTLDAIAQAINQKAGTQVAMTPAQMVTAIGAISGGEGGVAIQSGHFTPADESSTYSVVVNNEIASNKFVAIFTIDSEVTPVNLGLVEGIFFVPDPSVAIAGGNKQIGISSAGQAFDANLLRITSNSSWNPSTKTLVMSARAGSNFYAGSQYTYVIIPLSALVSVYR